MIRDVVVSTDVRATIARSCNCRLDNAFVVRRTELRGPTTEWLVGTSMLLALAAYTAGAPDPVRCRRFNADSRCPPALPPRDRYPSFPRQNHRARRFPPAHDSDPQWADAGSDVRS